jgi:uncharacterized protein (DUF779 family)
MKTTGVEMTTLEQIRQALADYMASEGCSCCQNSEAHHEAALRLGKLLDIPAYTDGSGIDFWKFRED